MVITLYLVGIEVFVENLRTRVDADRRTDEFIKKIVLIVLFVTGLSLVTSDFVNLCQQYRQYDRVRLEDIAFTGFNLCTFTSRNFYCCGVLFVDLMNSYPNHQVRGMTSLFLCPPYSQKYCLVEIVRALVTETSCLLCCLSDPTSNGQGDAISVFYKRHFTVGNSSMSLCDC